MNSQTLNILMDTHLFNDIPEEYLSNLACFERTYGKNEIIIHAGDSIDSIYILKKGSVISEKIHEEGDVELLSVYAPGDLLGFEVYFSTFKKSPYFFVSQQNAVVLKLSPPSDDIYREIFLKNTTHILADETIRSMYKIEALSKHRLRDRVMTHLLIMKQKKGTDVFNIHMTQEQLARYLCVSRSALSHELNNMKRDGLIDFKRSSFRILK